MIRYVTRNRLDIQKYDDCIARSIQSNIFGFSWYLDIVTEHWDALILNDYEAVMPIPRRRKFWIRYVYPPLWLIQLGIYSIEVEDENEFLIELLDRFKWIELRMNSKNHSSFFQKFKQNKQLQVITLDRSYEEIYSKYNRNRKREIAKAQKSDLIESWNDNPKVFLNLFVSNVGKRLKTIEQKDYDNLLVLMETALQKRVGELLTIYDKNMDLVSGAFFLKHNKRVTELVCSSNFSNRKQGANTFMNDRAIYRYHKHFDIFDFGGSSMKNIAKYYKSFGAKDEAYFWLHYHKLPTWIHWLRKIKNIKF